MIDVRRLGVAGATIALAVAIMLVVPGSPSARVSHGSTRPVAHVYLLRGLMNIFSLGMDQLADRIEANGITASVHNHSEYEALADQAIANYRAGRERTVIIVGHSLGADAAVLMANRLGEAGVPVRLVVTFDPVTPTVASGNIAHVINLYLSNGLGVAVSAGAGFRGILQNVDLRAHGDLGHTTIDKSPLLQQQVLGDVLRAVGSARGPASASSARSRHGIRPRQQALPGHRPASAQHSDSDATISALAQRVAR